MTKSSHTIMVYTKIYAGVLHCRTQILDNGSFTGYMWEQHTVIGHLVSLLNEKWYFISNT